jgi:hypothetical protein
MREGHKKGKIQVFSEEERNRRKEVRKGIKHTKESIQIMREKRVLYWRNKKLILP